MESQTSSAGQQATALDFSTKNLLTLGTYAVAGFIVGFLLKYFGRLLISIILGTLVIVLALNYFNFIAINYDSIKNFLGISDQQTINNLLQFSVYWIKTHMAESLAAAIGFLIGWMYT